jgi:MFS family permease
VAAGSLRNFYVMAINFSITHGCVTSCLSYGTAELGDDLGGFGNGTLYICYAFVALFLSSEILMVTGPKKGLILGLWGYCVYVLGFLLALLSKSNDYVAYPVFITSSVIGGCAGGMLWTAQGEYFSREAAEHARLTGLGRGEANAKLAGIFATAYLGMEVVTKCVSTGLFLTVPNHATTIVFIVYTVLSVISAGIILYISDLGTVGSFKLTRAGISITKLENVRNLLASDDKRILYLMPMQVSFGLSTSLLIYYVFGTIIANSDHLGADYVGFLAAIIVVVGTIMGIPSAWFTAWAGKEPLMIVGALCFTFIGFTLLFEDDDQLGTWGGIMPYLMLQGLGRGVWENTNKATVADLFGDDKNKVSTILDQNWTARTLFSRELFGDMTLTLCFLFSAHLLPSGERCLRYDLFLQWYGHGHRVFHLHQHAARHHGHHLWLLRSRGPRLLHQDGVLHDGPQTQGIRGDCCLLMQ